MSESARRRLQPVRQLPACGTILRFVAAEPCHLVGGVLRDTWLGRPPRDIDVVVRGDGHDLATALAESGPARLVELGGDRFAAWRVRVQGSTVDIWGRGSQTLAEDLLRRDLTIHAFAMDLATGTIIDPGGGIEDLRRRCLRMTTPASFANDPLRVLRLARFAAELSGFAVDSTTLERALEAVPRLTTVASERIRQELEASLTAPAAAAAIRLWVELAVLPGVLLETAAGPADRRSMVAACQRAGAAVETIAAALPGVPDLSDARFAILLHLLADHSGETALPSLNALLDRGFITRSRHHRIRQLLALSLPPTDEAGRRWFLHSLGSLWPQAIACSAARAAMASGGEARSGNRFEDLQSLITLAREQAETIFEPPALVTGNDLQRDLGVAPGARLGRLLAALRRQQIEGSISTPRQALELAARLDREWGTE